MRLRRVWIIYIKELRETLKDKRVLFLLLGLPMLFFPIVIIFSGFFIEAQIQKQFTRVMKIGIVGSFPSDLEKLLYEDKEKKVETDPIKILSEEKEFCQKTKNHLQDKKYQAFLLINQQITCKEKNDTTTIENGPFGRFELIYDHENDFSGTTFLLYKKSSEKILQTNT